jgi:type IV secretory pathway TraG/TraD family ATPase VirD4
VARPGHRHSVKADLITATIDHRRTLGKVFVYDPTGAAGVGASATWSPIGACSIWSGAMRSAAWLAEAAQPRRDSVTDGDYWYTQARCGLAPYLFAAGLGERGMGEVVRWIDAQDERDIAEILDTASYDDDPAIVAGAEAALAVAEGLWGREERLKGSVFSTIENILAPYADPGVVAAGATSGINFSDWLAGTNTIYVVATAHEQARLRPVLSVLVQQAVRTAYDTAAKHSSGRLDHPLLVMLDEAANIAPLPDLPGYAATARSHAITLVSIWQDLAQLRNLYGVQAQSLLNNHRAKLFGSGIADIDSLDYLSRLMGEQRHTERQHSRDIDGARRSVSEHASFRRLAPPDLLRRVRPGHAVLVYGAELPAYVTLCPWYADRALSQLGTPTQ